MPVPGAPHIQEMDTQLVLSGDVHAVCPVIAMTHRLTLPYSLDHKVSQYREKISQLMDRWIGSWFMSPPVHGGGESDRSFAVKAQVLSLAVRAPA